MKKTFTILIAALLLLTMITQPRDVFGQEKGTFTGTFTKITSASDFETGFYVITGSESASTTNKALGSAVDGNKRITGVSVTISNSTTITNPSDAVVYYITKDGNTCTFKNVSTGKYMYQASTTSGKGMGFQNSSANITLAGYNTNSPIGFRFTLNGASNNYLKWNNGSSWYANYANDYTTSMAPVTLFKCPAYNVTYNANGGSGTMTDSNNPYASGATVTVKTNTFTAPTGKSFNGWNTEANGSGTSYAAGATFAISANTTLYAQWAAATTVSTPSIYLDGGTYTGNQSTTISCGTDGASIYYTLDGTNPSSSNGTLYSGAITIDHSCTLKAIGIKDGLTDSEIASATYTIKVNTPSFTPTGGNLFQTTLVTISCETVDALIYYTTDGTDPTSGSTLYSSAISVSSAQTIKAIAIKSGLTNSDVATATYTFPTVKTIAEARAYPNTTDFFYTRGVVTYVVGDGKTAYIQDETAAIAIYKNDNSFTSGLSVGDDIVVYGKKTTYHGLVEVGTATIVTTLSNGNTVSPTVKTVAAINTDYGSGLGNNDFQSMFVKIEKATYNGSNSVTQSGSSITVEGAMGSAVNGDAVTFTGIIGCYDAVKIINLDNVEIVNDPTILAAESLTVPSYVQGTPVANITAGSLSVSGSNLSADITCTLDDNSKFELYNGSEWTNTTTIAQTSGSASGSLQIRLKANQSYNASAYTGSVTLRSTGVDDVVVSLSGSVTYATLTYDANEATTGTAPSALSTCTYGQEITLSGEDDLKKTGYNFGGWNTLANGEGTNYDAGAKYTIHANTTLYAKWNPASFDIVTSEMTGGSVAVKIGDDEVTSATTGATVTLVVTPAANHVLSNLTVTQSPSGSVTLSPTVSSSVLTYTFTMPANNITVSATFEEYYALTIDFESALNTYSNWSFDKITRSGESTSAHGGSYYATNSSNQSSATITTVNKIAKPGKLTFWVKRTSNNTNTANWRVKTKTENGSWTERGSQDATPADWTKFELDLSSYENVYVQIAYDGNTALRAIDDISLEYTPSEYAVTLSSVSGGTISASDGTTTITSGSDNFETGKTITLTAEGNATHMFSAWTVTGATVDDASSATTTFEMPANAVTVSATFVESWTFTYNINGNVVTEKYAKNNASITLPTTSEYVPEGYAIIGWTETEGNVLSPITSVEASGNRTLYAVFGKITYSDFALVESAPSNWSGYYLIVYDNKKVFDTHYSNNLNTNTYATIADISTYYSNKVIAYNATTAQYIVKIEETTNGYSIYDKDGYLGNSSNSNGSTLLWNDEFTAEQNEWTLGVNSIVGVKNSSRAIRYNLGSPRFAIYATDGQEAIQLFKTTVSYEGVYTHIYPSNATATGDINVSTSGPIVIESGATLDMGSYDLSCDDATKLIIEDGAQLVTKSSGVKATVKKNVAAAAAWGGQDPEDPYTPNGWYFVASPVNGAAFPTGSVADQDIFQLDWANKKWLNLQNDANNSLLTGGFQRGTGYLYASKDGNTVSVAGEIQPLSDSDNATITLTTTGWHLIGNPLTCKVTVSCAFSELVNGSAVTNKDANSVINPCQGIAVYKSTEGSETVTFTKAESQAAAAPSNNNSLQMTLAKKVTSRGETSTKVVDNAIVSFNESKGMPKFNMLGGSAKLYIPQNDEEYSVVFSDKQGDLPLNFKADEIGTYTINFETNDRASLQGIYLIDILEQKEIDLSVNPSYTFIGSPADRTARFKIVFRNVNGDSTSDIFAYQSGNDIIVSGEGELQIFDVMGRLVKTQHVSGVQTINVNAQGVYIMKLNDKVQKIVVR